MPACRIAGKCFLSLNYVDSKNLNVNHIKAYFLRVFRFLFNLHNTGSPIDVHGAAFMHCDFLLGGMYLWQLWEMIICVKQKFGIL